MKRLFTFLMIPWLLTAVLCQPSAAGDEKKLNGKLVQIELTFQDAAGKEIRVPVTTAHRIKTGDRVTVKDGKARKGGKQILAGIELIILDAGGEQQTVPVKEVHRIKVGEKVDIRNGKAKQRGKGRGC